MPTKGYDPQITADHKLNRNREDCIISHSFAIPRVRIDLAKVLRSIPKYKFTPKWNCRNLFLGNAYVGTLGNFAAIETKKMRKLQQ